jgi:propionyl-CoA carboxylase alpha chain/3-methylcrotonyl-CoA carboxylase alpha subunit
MGQFVIESLLIANRGEIARRIIRTARRMGVRTIAVYSEADAGAPHVYEADEAVAIGPSPAAESYLVADRILEAARATGAAAIHPGYGFLSENAAFAEAVIAAGMIWVGPPPSAIRAMGLKDAAKKLMAEAGVPVTPGYLGEDQSEARLAKEAAAIGWPVLIKAVAGGGGKGMRKVERAEDFAAALAAAKRESKAAFGNDDVLLEKYAERPRHIEVQVFADSHGNAVHLFERDCSLQRRHQKVIEEAPAPGMDAATREAICAAAVRAAEAVGYEGAGTVEFIADASDGLRADRIWFMEMNTRLQVEHPVTEAITGVDLVEWQLRVASGEPLPKRQDELSIDGWAMEARLYAENPATGFLPSTGPLTHFRLPDGLRVDSAVEEGGEVTAFYDPMIAKLIAHAPTRTITAAVLAEGCREVEVWPVKTNAAFLARCLDAVEFTSGAIDTGFIERNLTELVAAAAPSPQVLALAAVERAADVASGPYDPSPWASHPDGLFGFRLNRAAEAPLVVAEHGRMHAVTIGVSPDQAWRVKVAGEMFDCEHERGRRWLVGERSVEALWADGRLIAFDLGEVFEFSDDLAGADAGEIQGDAAIRSPMPGKVVAVNVAAGDAVTKGQTLLTLEAMKMEHALTAAFDGKVAELNVAAGDQVAEGVVLARLEKAD